MRIQTAAIVGAGALGTMYGYQIMERLGKEAVRIVTDPARRLRYETEGVFANGRPCRFSYMDGTDKAEPADLVIFAVKFGGLEEAMEMAAPVIGPSTVILSVMNGITSEEILAERFGGTRVLLCTAQGMDATRRGNDTRYDHIGSLWIGAGTADGEPLVEAAGDFLERAGIPYEAASDMPVRLWRKLMLNVGVNQVTAVYECGYGGVKQPGEARSVMEAAMRETLAAAQAEGVPLTEKDMAFWFDLLPQFSDEGTTSMRQDLLAGRRTEVELFAGTIRRIADKHGLSVPVNDLLYRLIRKMEETS